MSESTEQVLADEVSKALALETEVAAMEAQLSANPEFQAFLQKQKEATKQIASFWKHVEAEMIDHDIKSIKGDWGSITIAERIGWDLDPLDDLPAKFYKKVPDLKRMTDYFRLEGKAPKGAMPKYTKYLTKRIKGQEGSDLLKEIYN